MGKKGFLLPVISLPSACYYINFIGSETRPCTCYILSASTCYILSVLPVTYFPTYGVRNASLCLLHTFRRACYILSEKSKTLICYILSDESVCGFFGSIVTYFPTNHYLLSDESRKYILSDESGPYYPTNLVLPCTLRLTSKLVKKSLRQ